MRMFVFALMSACMFAASATPYVTNIVARQRMPWNGLVDVTYEIVGATNGLECVCGQLTATDRTHGKTYVASTFEKAIDLSEGKHTAIWNMAADNSFTSKNVVFNMSIQVPALYCVIDLSGGPDATSYPVSELDDVPEGGWTDEYKTTKLVMRLCPAGVDPLGRYTLTKAFYAGVFEVTQKQWQLVMGSSPSQSHGWSVKDTSPVIFVSYDMIRGSDIGACWPLSSRVDDSGFIGRLRARTVLVLDLPTEAQWEYVCRSGTSTAYSYGDTANCDYMWCCDNSDHRGVCSVGTLLPNKWGIYGMHGNASEWCLDWYGNNLIESDPKGSDSGTDRSIRGGNCDSYSDSCKSSRRSCSNASDEKSTVGFRLFRILP